MSWQGRTAWITGASSGIGAALAEALAAEGAALILSGRRRDALEELAARLGGDSLVLPFEATDRAALPGAVEAAWGWRDGVDMLVNNAGYATRGRVAELDPDALDAMLRVNILALSRLSAAAMKAMTAAGRGTIINIASGTVFMQMPGNAGYGASKNYVMAFTRHMQVEAAGTGVRVQLLVPGVIATDFHEVAGNDLVNFPPERVMQADDLVVASLRALEMDEPVCIPSLPEIRDWDNYVAAEALVAKNCSRDRPAARYHGA